MLHINNLSYRIVGRPIFDSASATVHKGDNVGFIGRNGTGKTTLLRIISGEIHSEPGEINFPNNTRVGKVAQEAPSGDTSLIDTVLATDHERASLLKEAESATDPTRIVEIHERLVDIDADTAPSRAARILAGLGFNEEAQQQPCSSLSGGWRMRVALASLLFAEPDFLLLDEPTNHLDLEATIWLESYLKSYPGTLLLVSHDRSLLNNVANKIIHLENQQLVSYTGNYDQFEQIRRERLDHQAAQHAKQQEQRKHIQSFIDRFKAKASKAKQAQSRVKMLERMEPIAAVAEDSTLAFDFPSPKELAPPLINLDQVSIGYEPGKAILKNLNLRLDMEDRIALLGANGNGKSTLVKLLAGRLEAQEGLFYKSSKLKIGYFAQDQAEELDLEATPYTLMARLMKTGTPESKVRAQLGRFGFGVNHVSTKVGALSGGEKARLLFALTTRDAPHILLMDEPTNHLDVDSREALVQAMNSFEGAIVLVSHDPHLIELTADRFWLVGDGTVKSYDGDLEDYKKLLIEQRRQERQKTRIKNDDTTETADAQRSKNISKKDKRRAAAEARAAGGDLKKAVRMAEQKVEKLQAKKEKLEIELADPAIYENSNVRQLELTREIGKIDKELSKAEEEWLTAQEKYEAAN
ncbi:ABC-F family ATP-binding cassette domain-containing protein [Kiloniella laminariae]|uniref:ABC-F family ATP-binding cassette domain-containing protein n=1 Tax=Kiloniella laminariae TaxID=454162 RepID=A0ABT4LGZ4_9PROT|nr:ABC-F family ATP-binding cassette domain-containing protein [Kiloniella laminariae]MCZ4280375.1 ABC-F family ATP-binding cassette domain-containing protein [Kiloniella laminariae]